MQPESESFVRLESRVPLVREPDVAVVGAGPAGWAAALAAGRAGARTMLIERWGVIGGMATAGLVQGVSSLRQRRGGMFPGAARELFRLLAQRHPDAILDVGGEGITAHPDILAAGMTEMLREAGVEIWLQTSFIGLRLEGRAVSTLVLHNKSGLLAVRPKAVVDGSGDGDVASQAGAPMRKGGAGGAMQPASVMFFMSGVDLAQAEPWINRPVRLEDIGVSPQQLADLIPPDLPDFRSEPGLLPLPQGRVLFFRLPGDQVVVNMTRLCGLDGTVGRDVSRGEVDGRRQTLAIVELLRRFVPGFGQAQLVRVASAIGIRETRTIEGLYTMTAGDVMCERRFPDAVAFGSYPIDIHNPTGVGVDWREPERSYYEIPYRALLPRGVDNLLTAGRCVSADHEALASVRIQGTAMATGQAAGIAAALTATTGGPTASIDAERIRRRMAQVLEFADWRWGDEAPAHGASV